MLKRFLDLDLPKGQSIFLWGARKTGKSTFLKSHFPGSVYIDCLDHDSFLTYSKNPMYLRNFLSTLPEEKLEKPIIIDEVQKVPEVLDEIHWIIENMKGVYFILCGSSLRKLKHAGANLLGGRAWSQSFFPLCYPEFDQFDLLKALSYGLIPNHYLAEKYPRRSLKGYLGNYLIPEVQWESHIRKMSTFTRFLDAISFSNAQMLNYANIARECAVNVRTVESYVELLVDMLLAYKIYPYAKTPKRSLIKSTPKFYFFDTGLVNEIAGRTILDLKGPEVGHLLEQYIFLELLAYKELNERDFDITYWRTSTGLEVDFVLGRGEAALEIKLSRNVVPSDIRGLIEFAGDYNPAYSAVVCLEPRPRKITVKGKDILILPVEDFLKSLWTHRLPIS
jgi:predicted AAA+ superfamily ATPase